MTYAEFRKLPKSEQARLLGLCAEAKKTLVAAGWTYVGAVLDDCGGSGHSYARGTGEDRERFLLNISTVHSLPIN